MPASLYGNSRVLHNALLLKPQTIKGYNQASGSLLQSWENTRWDLNDKAKEWLLLFIGVILLPTNYLTSTIVGSAECYVIYNTSAHTVQTKKNVHDDD